MGLDNPLHIAFLLMILLLVFGAKRLPEMGRSLGEGLRGFKETISGEAHTQHAVVTNHSDAIAPAANVVQGGVVEAERSIEREPELLSS